MATHDPMGPLQAPRPEAIAAFAGSRRARLTCFVAALGAASLAPVTGCGVDEGFVELNWQFVDARQRKIYPGGRASDVCDLPGTRGDETARYDLRARLTISESDCDGGPGDEACQVIPPRTFSCRRSRASLTAVPANEDVAYTMTVDVVVDPTDGSDPFVPLPSCAAVPGPRERRVLPGGTVDLQVYQLVISGIDPSQDSAAERRLDLEACSPASLPPDEGGTGGV